MLLGGSPKFIGCSALKIGGLTAMDQFASKWNCEELCIWYVSGPPQPIFSTSALSVTSPSAHFPLMHGILEPEVDPFFRLHL
jgi:hypothetical protein